MTPPAREQWVVLVMLGCALVALIAFTAHPQDDWLVASIGIAIGFLVAFEFLVSMRYDGQLMLGCGLLFLAYAVTGLWYLVMNAEAMIGLQAPWLAATSAVLRRWSGLPWAGIALASINLIAVLRVGRRQ